MTAVLNHLQLLPSGFIASTGDKYSELKGDTAAAITKYFDLPTTVGGIKKMLTESEEKEREDFNRHYPYISVL